MLMSAPKALCRGHPGYPHFIHEKTGAQIGGLRWGSGGSWEWKPGV